MMLSAWSRASNGRSEWPLGEPAVGFWPTRWASSARRTSRYETPDSSRYRLQIAHRPPERTQTSSRSLSGTLLLDTLILRFRDICLNYVDTYGSLTGHP